MQVDLYVVNIDKNVIFVQTDCKLVYIYLVQGVSLCIIASV